MESYLGVARKEGISSREINTIQAIVMAVAAGKIRAEFREVKSRTVRTKPSKE